MRQRVPLSSALRRANVSATRAARVPVGLGRGASGAYVRYCFAAQRLKHLSTNLCHTAIYNA
jgi:hypothetical protein